MRRTWAIASLLALSSSCGHDAAAKRADAPKPGHAHHHGHGHHGQHADRDRPEALELSERLSTVLREEMRLIEREMGHLSASLDAGDHPTAAASATKIARSFILEQELSDTEIQELDRALPEAFVNLDREFHDNADALAKAVQTEDLQRARSMFTQMRGACAICHTQYAPQL